MALAVECDDLAVDDGVGQLRGGFCDGRKLLGPVEPLAGFECHLTVLDPHLDAVTVELDLVHPAFRRWRTRRNFA